MVWNDLQWYSYSLPFLLMQTFWMDTHWMDPYWWDTCWRYVLVGYVLVRYVCDSCWCTPFEWIRIAWIRTGGIRVERIRIGGIRIANLLMQTFWMHTHCMDTYWWDTFWMDMCGICVVWWICVGYVWCEICVGYVWCEIRQQSSEEPCDETSFGKNTQSSWYFVKIAHIETPGNKDFNVIPKFQSLSFQIAYTRPFFQSFSRPLEPPNF